MRLLIFLGLIYFGYRALKSWMRQNITTQNTVFDKVGDMDNVMIKDPFCDVYFPKREGVHLKLSGQDIYFCSTECKDKFIASRSAK
jgi:uncharacterized protein